MQPESFPSVSSCTAQRWRGAASDRAQVSITLAVVSTRTAMMGTQDCRQPSAESGGLIATSAIGSRPAAPD